MNHGHDPAGAGCRRSAVPSQIGLLDEPPPRGELLLDQPAELLGRPGLHVDPPRDEQGRRVAAGQHLDERGVEGADHAGGGPGRSEDPVPLGHVDHSREGHDATPTSIEPDLAELRADCDAANLSVDIAPAESFLEPSEHVLKVAQEVDATLIVVGQRHRSRIGKFLLGSSVQRIVLEADCPVVTVKGTAGAPG